MDTSTRTDTDRTELDDSIANAQAAAELAREATAQLERHLKLARGTREIAPVPAPVPQTPEHRVLEVLRVRTASVVELAKSLNAEIPATIAVMQGLRKAGKVAPVGSVEMTRWTAVLGDDAPTSELYPLIVRLIQEQPMTTQELVQATGARAERVSGGIVHLQRTSTRIMNLGRGNLARWFIVPASARAAVLEPKRARRALRRSDDKAKT